MVRVLLVDDEPDIVYLIKKILEKKGHDVILAYSGEEALMKTEKENPDIVLLDVMMPGMNGWEVSRNLKSREENKELQIVMLTVRTCPESVSKSISYACADAHIGKPASGEEILSTIESVMTHSN